MKERTGLLSGGFLCVMTFIMLLPILATFLNSISTEWSDTILPPGLSGAFYRDVLTEPRFHAALLRSLIVSVPALVLATLIFVPAIIVAHFYWPALDRWMARLVILPYAIPGIVLTVGYLRVFSSEPFAFVGSPLILIFVYIPVCFPLSYLCVKNSLRGIDGGELLDAGRLLGVSDFTVHRRVVVPCILPGVMVSIVLNFAGLISEFVYAKMLVGGSYETLQMYMFSQRDLSGRLSSVIVILYFILILIITVIAFRLVRQTEHH